ncbi:MAG: WG repeat-containing protein [Bacteroidales bacterium]|nr:WG repeat-containing protein [Bacteroidales bacterium]
MHKKNVILFIVTLLLTQVSFAQGDIEEYDFSKLKFTNKIRFTERTKTVYIAGENYQIYYSGGVFIINEDRGSSGWGEHDIRWHFLDSTGAYLARNVVFKAPYRSFIPYFENGLAISKPGEGARIINKKNEIVASLEQYSSVSDSLRDGALLAIRSTKELCYVGVDGKVKWPHLIQQIDRIRDIGINMSIPPLRCDRRRYFELATRLYGYIDSNGKMIIKPQFLEARDFSEGLAAVKVNTDDGPKWGFIDVSGKFVIEPMFQHVPRDFNDGGAILTKNTGWKTFMDNNGNIFKGDFRMIDNIVDTCALMMTWDNLFYILNKGKWLKVPYNTDIPGLMYDLRSDRDANPPIRYTRSVILTGDYRPILISPYGSFSYLGGGFFWYSRGHDSDDIDVPSGVIRFDGERVFVFRTSEF